MHVTSHCSLSLSPVWCVCVCDGGGVDMLLDVCCSFSLQPNLPENLKIRASTQITIAGVVEL